MASISELGFALPVLVDSEGAIIAGHARVEAARRLNTVEVPILIASDWSKAQVRAYRLADNRLAELASWDDELLAIELSALIELDEIPIEVLGWETAEIDLITDGDPAKISYGQLLQIYFSVAHDPTEVGGQYPDRGPSYRSAIFPQDSRQATTARAYMAWLSNAHVFPRALSTRLEQGSFYPAEASHQHFMRDHPDFPLHLDVRPSEAGGAPDPLPGFLSPAGRMICRHLTMRTTLLGTVRPNTD